MGLRRDVLRSKGERTGEVNIYMRMWIIPDREAERARTKNFGKKTRVRCAVRVIPGSSGEKERGRGRREKEVVLLLVEGIAGDRTPYDLRTSTWGEREAKEDEATVRL